jgi:hypothetical protein
VLLVRQGLETRLELRIVDDVFRCVDRCDRRIDANAELDPLRAGLRPEDVAQHRLQFAIATGVIGILRPGPFLEQIRAPDAFAEVLPERLLRSHEQHVTVLRFVHLVAHAFLHAAGGYRTALPAVGLVAGDHVLGAAIRHVALDAVPVEGGGGVALCQFHEAAFAGFACPQHTRQNRQPAEQRGRIDADADVLRDVAETLFVVGRGHGARPGVVGDAVRRHVLVRAAHAVAGNGDEHDLRVHLLQLFVAETEACQCAGLGCLDHHVGVLHQVAVDLPRLFLAEIQRDALLAAIEVQVHQRHALDDRPGHFADVVAGGCFDLDHVRAEIDEGGSDCRRSENRAFDDAQAGKRCCFVHGVSLVRVVVSGSGQAAMAIGFISFHFGSR